MIDVDFLFYQDQYGGTRIPDEKHSGIRLFGQILICLWP